MTPFLFFVVISVLALVLVFEGFRNLQLNLSVFHKCLLVFGLGLVGSLISYFLVQRIEPAAPEISISAPVYDEGVTHSLEKARKPLQRVTAGTSGELRYHVSLLEGEVKELERSLQQKQRVNESHSEYLKVEKIFGFLQIMSACMMAFAHGANDVANAIGPLSAAVAVLTTGIYAVDAPIPLWALGLGGVGIVIGLATWGWRVMDTIGKKITELTPSRGFAAEFGAATTIVLASRLGMPISTTHTLVGAVLGVLRRLDVLGYVVIGFGAFVDAAFPLCRLIDQVRGGERMTQHRRKSLQQRQCRLGGGRVPGVVRHGCPE